MKYSVPLLSLLSLITFLAACVPVATPAAPPAPAVAETTSGCEPGFRLFDHEYLATDPICIPENPQRIIAVDAYSLETVLAFGVKPIASSSVKPFAVNYPELADQVAGVIDTGGPFNIETGLTTDADLIIAIEPWVGEIYAQATAIAPVVSINFDEIMWDGFVDLIGQVLNRPEQIEPLTAGYTSRVAILHDTLTAQSRQGSISVVQFYNDVLRLYFIEDLFPYLFPVSGLVALPQQTAALNGEWRIEVSKEELELLNTDYIFLVTYATNDEEIAANQAMVERLQADPLWQQLDAVGKEQVFVVPFYWNAGAVIGQHKMVDDLFRYVAQVDPATVAPNPFAPPK
ncbi:MAG: ABC transporter substrate-binding protein [Caldilineaceae bacterium]|nr:ABC transporter substrate-binding protein [Caldilineaceae bacterium]